MTVEPELRLTTQEAAARAGVTDQAVRDWCRRYQIGAYDLRFGRYLIEPAKLRALLLRRRGVLPPRACAIRCLRRDLKNRGASTRA
jgi:hypothetical protein